MKLQYLAATRSTPMLVTALLINVPTAAFAQNTAVSPTNVYWGFTSDIPLFRERKIPVPQAQVSYGRTLEEASKNFNVAVYGGGFWKDHVVTCDKEPGWTAYVALLDGPMPSGRSPIFPKYGIGVVCSRPSRDDALSQAFSSAFAALRKEGGAKPIYYDLIVGYSAVPSYTPSQSFIKSYYPIAFASKCGIPPHEGNNGKILPGVSVPSNAKDFLAYLRNLPVANDPLKYSDAEQCVGWDMNSHGLTPPQGHVR